MKIVIAEHSARIMGHIKKCIADIPGIMIVGEASSSEDARAVTQDMNPDIVILDFQIPGDNGLSLIHQIKHLPGQPIMIVLPNLSLSEYCSACFQAGADYFLDKSLEFERIQEIVKALIQRSQRSRSRQSLCPNSGFGLSLSPILRFL